MARGAGRSLRGTARRGGETPPPAPPRPAPASARPPAGRQPRHAESRPAPLHSAPRGRGAPRARRGWAGAGGVAWASGCPAPALGPAPTWGARAGRTHLRGAGAEPPGGLRGAAVVAVRGAPVWHRPPARSLAAPSAGGSAAPRAGRAEGREEAAGRPARPRALRLRRRPRPPRRHRPSRCGCRPKCAPLRPGRPGTHRVIPFTCRLKCFLPAALHPFVPPSLCPRPDGPCAMPGRRPEPRSRRDERPAAADAHSFLREAPRQQVTSERSPRLPQAPRVLPRRPKDERDSIAGASCSSTHPSVTRVRYTRPGFPKAGKACQVKREEMPLARVQVRLQHGVL